MQYSVRKTRHCGTGIAKQHTACAVAIKKLGNQGICGCLRIQPRGEFARALSCFDALYQFAQLAVLLLLGPEALQVMEA